MTAEVDGDRDTFDFLQYVSGDTSENARLTHGEIYDRAEAAMLTPVARSGSGFIAADCPSGTGVAPTLGRCDWRSVMVRAEV